MKPYRLHIFVCQGKRCSARGSEEVRETFKSLVKHSSLSGVRVSKSGCLKVCKETDVEGQLCPAVVIYPAGVWYKNVGVREAEEIVESHVKKGEVVERLLLFKLQG